jgi:hypothetical protein
MPPPRHDDLAVGLILDLAEQVYMTVTNPLGLPN